MKFLLIFLPTFAFGFCDIYMNLDDISIKNLKISCENGNNSDCECYNKTINLKVSECKEKNNLSCIELGDFYLSYYNDVIKAKEFLNIACDNNNALACEKIAFLGIIFEQNKKLALSYYKKACDLGLKSSCNKIKELTKSKRLAKLFIFFILICIIGLFVSIIIFFIKQSRKLKW